jgi:hypothetical protein
VLPQSVAHIQLSSNLWRLFDEFGRKEAEWLPFWRNAAYVTLTPGGAYASLYKHPKNGVLAVVSNLSKDTAKIRVHFDLEKLGLRANCTMKNALTSEPLAISDNSVEMDLSPTGWKIIWLR